MAEQIVSGVVPPVSRAPAQGAYSPQGTGQGLPVPALSSLSSRQELSRAYGMGRVDASGRVYDRTILLALQWSAGQRLAVTVAEKAVVFRPDPGAVLVLPSKPYVAIPAAARVRCGIGIGDRVLLTAELEQGVLAVHPVWAVDELLAQHVEAVVGGVMP